MLPFVSNEDSHGLQTMLIWCNVG